MIYINNKEVTSIFIGNKPLSIIYNGLDIVWQSIRSCFGSGAWFSEKPWLNEEGWKN